MREEDFQRVSLESLSSCGEEERGHDVSDSFDRIL